jgi:hypothetical protein
MVDEVQGEQPTSGSSVTAEDIFKILDQNHPAYDEWSPTWEIYRDICGDGEPEKTRYLHKNKLEPTDQYEFRLKISELIPESQRSISRLTGALFKEKPKRELKDSRLDEFNEDVDLDGNSINGFMEEVIKSILAYGSTRILINARRTKSGRKLSRGQEKALKLRPYAIVYNPLSVIDWDYDDYGQLTMIRIKESRVAKLDPADPISPHVRIIKFIHYDREKFQWWEFAKQDGKVTLQNQDGDSHGLGVVPMVVKYWPRRVRKMIGSSYIRQMAKADLQRWLAESDQIYDTYIHAHPTLKCWTDEQMDKIGVGANSYLKLKPATTGQEKEDIEYLEIPTAAFEALRDVVKDKLDTVNRHSNTDPLGVVEPGTKIFQASGVARAWSFGMSEARILRDLADVSGTIERQIYELVLNYQTRGTPAADKKLFKGSVDYPDEFDLATTEQLILQTKEIGQLVNSPKLLRLLHKRIASSKAGDVTPKLVSEIHEEIEDNPLINTPVGKDGTNGVLPKLQLEGDLPQGGRFGRSLPNTSPGSKQGQRKGSFKTQQDVAKDLSS